MGCDTLGKSYTLLSHPNKKKQKKHKKHINLLVHIPADHLAFSSVCIWAQHIASGKIQQNWKLADRMLTLALLSVEHRLESLSPLPKNNKHVANETRSLMWE